jgi:hypothetical protein
VPHPQNFVETHVLSCLTAKNLLRPRFLEGAAPALPDIASPCQAPPSRTAPRQASPDYCALIAENAVCPVRLFDRRKLEQPWIVLLDELADWFGSLHQRVPQRQTFEHRFVLPAFAFA